MAAPPAAGATKAEWRAWARSLPPVPDHVARQVLAQLADVVSAVDGPVLGYVALPDEVPIDGLLPRGVLALPRLGAGGALSVHLDDGARERHGLGMDQPVAGLAALDPTALGAVLVPGRVFDREGYRLGRGGGHYDRLLSELADGTTVVGITTEARIVDRLPREPHDRPMTHLATEKGLFSTK